MFCTATMSAPMGVCRMKGAVSAPCTYENRFFECGDNLYCTATMTNRTGVCANQKSAGASCVDVGECLGRCEANRCTVPMPCSDLTP